MESWSPEDDRFSFLRSAPHSFSLCHREGPNRVEIFDITSIPSHRSSISETTCLCDIFGDDCESPALSSSPPSGSIAKREEDEFTLADDTPNDSPGSYHTASCSEQLSDSSETYEDSKEALTPVPSPPTALSEERGTSPSLKSKGIDLTPSPCVTPSSPECEGASPSPKGLATSTEATDTKNPRDITPSPEPRSTRISPELGTIATSHNSRVKSHPLESNCMNSSSECRVTHISSESETTTVPYKHWDTPSTSEHIDTGLFVEAAATAPSPEDRDIVYSHEQMDTELRITAISPELRATSSESTSRTSSVILDPCVTFLEPEVRAISPESEPRNAYPEIKPRTKSPESKAKSSETEPTASTSGTEPSATFPTLEISAASTEPESSTAHPLPEPISPDNFPQPSVAALMPEGMETIPSSEPEASNTPKEPRITDPSFEYRHTNFSSEPRTASLSHEPRTNTHTIEPRDCIPTPEPQTAVVSCETKTSVLSPEPQCLTPSMKCNSSDFYEIKVKGPNPEYSDTAVLLEHKDHLLESKSTPPGASLLVKSCNKDGEMTTAALANCDAEEEHQSLKPWFISETVMITSSGNQKKETNISNKDAQEHPEPLNGPQKPEFSVISGESPREGGSGTFRDRKEREGAEEEQNGEEQGGDQGEGIQEKASYGEQQVELSFSARNRKAPVSPSSAPTYREPQPGMPAGCYSDCLLVAQQQQQKLLRAHSSQKENQLHARKSRLFPQLNRSSTTRSAPDCSSETSSMGSELDEADNEVKWFTDLAFRSLSSPQVDYLDVYNSSHRSSTNVSQPSTEDSPGTSAWSAYADLRGSVRHESEDLLHQPSTTLTLDGMDMAKRFEMGSFECIDVALESREEVRRGKRTVPKRQIHLKRRDTGELRTDDNGEAAVEIAAEAEPTQRRTRDMLLRQHSTPAAIQEELYKEEADSEPGDRKQKLQKSLSLDETSSKTKIASCLIKSVLSKKMQDEHKVTNPQVPLQNRDTSSTMKGKVPSESSQSAGETPKMHVSNLSSRLLSDCSLSSEDLPLQVDPTPQNELSRHQGRFGTKTQLKPSCRNSYSPPQSGTGNLESQKNNGAKLGKRSELVIPFESKKTEKQIGRETWKQNSKETEEKSGRETEKQSDKEIQKQSNRETEKQNVNETWKQSGRQKGKQSSMGSKKECGKESWERRNNEIEYESERETERTCGRDVVKQQKKRNLSEKCFSDSANASSQNIGTAAIRSPNALNGMTNRDEECYARQENYKQQSTKNLFMSKTPEIKLKPCATAEKIKSSLKAGCLPGDSESKLHDSCELPLPLEKEKQNDKMESKLIEQTENEEAFEKSKSKIPMHKVRDVRKLVKNKYNLSFKATAVLAQDCVSQGEVDKPTVLPVPMQIECKAISRRGEEATAKQSGEGQTRGEEVQMPPQFPQQKLRETASLRITSRSCLTEGVAMTDSHHKTPETVATDAKTQDVSESREPEKRTMDDVMRPPKFGNTPKLPSKDREVSTLLLLQNGLKEDRLEPGAPPPLGLTATSCSRSVSMLLKEKGFQADIGVCDPPFEGHNATLKHVNRLEVPVQTCLTKEVPVEPLREEKSSHVPPPGGASPSTSLPLPDTKEEPHQTTPSDSKDLELERTKENDIKTKDTTSCLPQKSASPSSSRYRPHLTEVTAVSTCSKKPAATASSTSKQQQSVTTAPQLSSYTQKSVPATFDKYQPTVSTISKQKPTTSNNLQQSNVTHRDTQEHVTIVSACSSDQSAESTTVPAPNYSHQPAIRTTSSKRTPSEDLQFYASDDPPSYEERESFSPLLLADLPPRKLDRYHPTTQAPPCSCTTDGVPSLAPPDLAPPASMPSSAQTLPLHSQPLPPLGAPPTARLQQQQPDSCSLSHKAGSPQAIQPNPAQPPHLFHTLHHPQGLPVCSAPVQQPHLDDNKQPQPSHQPDRRAARHRSPQQPALSGSGPYPGHSSHSPGMPSLEVRPQYLCSPQGFVPPFSSEFGGEGGGGSGVLYPEGGNSLTYGQSPRRVLLDPETGKYFYIEVPIQPLRKMLFDPETGQYVEVLIPQQALSHSGLYPPVAAPYPSMHSPSMYTPQYLPYSVPAHPQPPSPRHPDAPPTQGLHQNDGRFESPGSQGLKPEPQNHPPLDQSYLESMYYIPTGMTASPNPAPPDFYQKIPPSLPNSGGKRS